MGAMKRFAEVVLAVAQLRLEQTDEPEETQAVK